MLVFGWKFVYILMICMLYKILVFCINSVLDGIILLLENYGFGVIF